VTLYQTELRSRSVGMDESGKTNSKARLFSDAMKRRSIRANGSMQSDQPKLKSPVSDSSGSDLADRRHINGDFQYLVCTAYEDTTDG
jgi:hypothetical protein